MGYAEVIFVLIILLAGLWVTLMVRRDFLDREMQDREQQRRLEEEQRRRIALSRSYRSAPRR